MASIEKPFEEILQDGINCVRAGKLDEAMPHYDAALQAAQTSQQTIETLLCISALNRHQGLYDAAAEYYDRAMQLAPSVGDNVINSILAVAVNEEGNIKLTQKNYPGALVDFTTAFERISQTDYDSTTVLRRQIYANNLGLAHRLTGNLDQSAQFYGRAAGFALGPDGDRREGSRTLHELGNLAIDQGLFHVAAGRLQRSLDLKEQVGDERGQWFVLDSIAVLAARSGNTEAAAQLFPHTTNAPNVNPLPHHREWREKAMTAIGFTPVDNFTADPEQAKAVAARILSEMILGMSRPASTLVPKNLGASETPQL